MAIPARSEADRIGPCLTALAQQASGRWSVGVFVLCNNCDDDTAERARRFQSAGSIGVHVREMAFPPEEAHAGSARCAAMDWARSALDPKGCRIVASTDADSRVAQDWLPRLMLAMQEGADAVAGIVAFDPAEAAMLDFPPLRRLEDRYAGLQAQVDHLVDPREHDPWPKHLWAWGANLAVRADAFDRAGGMPCAPLAEDRAFAARLEEVDATIRHASDVRVFTSARTHGRAPGGLADLVAAHAAGGDLPCDAALEPIQQAYRRGTLRRRLRLAHAGGRVSPDLLHRLRLGRSEVEAALEAPFAGAAWSRIEALSPALRRARIPLARLPAEIDKAERLLGSLNVGDGRDGIARAAAGALWSAAPPPL